MFKSFLYATIICDVQLIQDGNRLTLNMGNVHQSTDLTFRFKLKPEHKGVQQEKLPFQVINIIIKMFFFNNAPNVIIV